MTPVLSELQSDHLLLLVGSNPLPNAVAARLLLKDGGTAHLLHSPATASIAKYLHHWLGEESSCLLEATVDASDPIDVAIKATQWLDSLRDAGGASRIGLHYTGGTKVMSVHARRTLRQALPDDVICSYLDPQTLSLCFDPAGDGKDGRYTRVGQAVQLGVDDVLQLHGDAVESIERGGPLQRQLFEALRGVVPPRCLRTGVYLGGMTYIDALAVRGYQLFMFTCARAPQEDARQHLKKELFRCYERARRIGGDEAHAGLVCDYADNPRGIEQEMATDFDAAANVPDRREMYRVFGQQDLGDLQNHIASWVAQETR